MSAGSDHEPIVDPAEVVEQIRAASERLRDQARILGAVSSPPVASGLDGDDGAA